MEYWLYIEPYTLFFRKKDKVLFYNTLDKKTLLLAISPAVSVIIDECEREKCIRLNAELLRKDDVKDFIYKIKKAYMGDVFSTLEGHVKPAIFHPIVNNQRSVARLGRQKLINTDNYILDCLEEISIYVNGFGESGNDIQPYKQTLSYIYDNNEIDINFLKRFLSDIPDFHVNQINLLGGDIINYKHIEEIMDIASTKTSRINVYYKYDYLSREALRVLRKHGVSLLTIVVPLYSLREDELEKVNTRMTKWKGKAQWLFLVSNDAQYELLASLIEEAEIENYNIKPVYDLKNGKFFDDNIFIDTNDMEDLSVSKREVFVRQEINSNDFGRLTILPNGNIHSNINFNSLGLLYKNSLSQILKNAFKSDSPWFRIRNGKPCNECVYQWLCPSPSNYEIILNKPNLCHIEK